MRFSTVSLMGAAAFIALLPACRAPRLTAAEPAATVARSGPWATAFPGRHPGSGEGSTEVRPYGPKARKAWVDTVEREMARRRPATVRRSSVSGLMDRARWGELKPGDDSGSGICIDLGRLIQLGRELAK